MLGEVIAGNISTAQRNLRECKEVKWYKMDEENS